MPELRTEDIASLFEALTKSIKDLNRAVNESTVRRRQQLSVPNFSQENSETKETSTTNNSQHHPNVNVHLPSNDKSLVTTNKNDGTTITFSSVSPEEVSPEEKSNRPGIFTGALTKSFEKISTSFNKGIQSITKPISDLAKIPGDIVKSVTDVPKKIFGGVSTFIGGIFGGKAKGLDEEQFNHLEDHFNRSDEYFIKTSGILQNLNTLNNRQLDELLNIKHFMWKTFDVEDDETLEQRQEAIKREKTQHEELMAALAGVAQASVMGPMAAANQEEDGGIVEKAKSGVSGFLAGKGKGLLKGAGKFGLGALKGIGLAGAAKGALVAGAGYALYKTGESALDAYKARNVEKETESQAGTQGIGGMQDLAHKSGPAEIEEILTEDPTNFDAAFHHIDRIRDHFVRHAIPMAQDAGYSENIIQSNVDALNALEREVEDAQNKFREDPAQYLQDGFSGQRINIPPSEEATAEDIDDEVIKDEIKRERYEQARSSGLSPLAAFRSTSDDVTEEDIETRRNEINEDLKRVREGRKRNHELQSATEAPEIKDENLAALSDDELDEKILSYADDDEGQKSEQFQNLEYELHRRQIQQRIDTDKKYDELFIGDEESSGTKIQSDTSDSLPEISPADLISLESLELPDEELTDHEINQEEVNRQPGVHIENNDNRKNVSNLAVQSGDTSSDTLIQARSETYSYLV